MSTAITARQTLTPSREGDWAVGGAVLGLTAALIQIIARRWRGEGGKRGQRMDVGEYGRTRIDLKKRMQEINRLNTNNVDALNSDGNINNAVFDTIEEEYYHNQYTQQREHHPEYPAQTGKYDLNNLNQDFPNVERNQHNTFGRKTKANVAKEKEKE
jgi:hypothetical protein